MCLCESAIPIPFFFFNFSLKIKLLSGCRKGIDLDKWAQQGIFRLVSL